MHEIRRKGDAGSRSHFRISLPPFYIWGRSFLFLFHKKCIDFLCKRGAGDVKDRKENYWRGKHVFCFVPFHPVLVWLVFLFKKIGLGLFVVYMHNVCSPFTASPFFHTFYFIFSSFSSILSSREFYKTKITIREKISQVVSITISSRK